jgi:protein-S-isoprenylcysteine O-methyltransferase Ste14
MGTCLRRPGMGRILGRWWRATARALGAGARYAVGRAAGQPHPGAAYQERQRGSPLYRDPPEIRGRFSCPQPGNGVLASGTSALAGFLAAVAAEGAPAPLDVLAWTITLGGIVVEAVADQQLTTFRARPHQQGRVLDTGLWRWTRHPNYFGDFLIWWGFFLAGIGAGAPWWTIGSPIVMSGLLIHFSGAGLMEETIADRRPAYRAYIARTSAFFPWHARD